MGEPLERGLRGAVLVDDFDYPLSPMAPEDDVMSPLSVRDRPRPGDGSDGSGGIALGPHHSI